MNFEGASYKAFFEKSDSNVDLFRFYNTATGAHFFTAFGWEKDAIVSNPTHDPFLAGMTFEGTAYYVLPQGGEHALPVWRFYNGSTGVHFYTASAAEKDGIVANPAHDPYLAQLKLEGIAYWVPDDQWHA
jgi:hypothetical protein